MRFAFATSIAALLASAAVSSASDANATVTVTFWTLDSVARTVYFTGNPDMADIAPVDVSCEKNVTVQFPCPWTGNFYAVSEGEPNVPGMLGEVNFCSWANLNFFDVSAIVQPNDTNNVKQLYPANAMTPVSGCETWPCPNAYWFPDDNEQTKSTDEFDFVCTLGTGSTGSNATANNNVTAGNNATANNSATAGNNITAYNNATANNNVTAGNNITEAY